MASKSKLQVLHAFYPLAHSLAAYNADNFTSTNSRRVIGRNLLRALGSTVMFAALLSVTSMIGWTCVVVELSWNERAYHLVSMLCIMQQFCIYASMTTKNGQIFDALQLLQQTVGNRKSWHFCLLAR